jgi:hypothetical protein
MTNDDIATLCESIQPALIYVAIGCSQRYYPEGQGSPQQYPPQIAATPGRKICILIDPLLEDVPRVFTQIGLPDPATAATQCYTIHGDIMIIPVRREFHWPLPWTRPEQRAAAAADTALLQRLVGLTNQGQVRLIVQDYSGTDIRPFFLQNAKPTHVLYDMTGHDGGCFIDFTRITLHRAPNGDFIQPPYSTLQSLQPLIPAAELQATMKDRSALLTNYAHRYYRVLRGVEPPRDWITPEGFRARLLPLFIAYGLPPIVSDPANLYRLIAAALCDFATIAGDYLDDEAIANMIQEDSPTGPALRAALDLMCLVANIGNEKMPPPPTENGVQ